MGKFWNWVKEFDPNASILVKKSDEWEDGLRPIVHRDRCPHTPPPMKYAAQQCDREDGHRGEHWFDDGMTRNPWVAEHMGWCELDVNHTNGCCAPSGKQLEAPDEDWREDWRDSFFEGAKSGLRSTSNESIAFYDDCGRIEEVAIDPDFVEHEAPWGEDVDYLSGIEDGALVNVFEEDGEPELCRHSNPGWEGELMCAQSVGHEGLHASKGYWWGEEKPEVLLLPSEGQTEPLFGHVKDWQALKEAVERWTKVSRSTEGEGRR
jgi:hypothetical protein